MDSRNFQYAGGCITPAQNTAQNHLKCCVDWVTCSFSTAIDLQQCFNLIGIDSMENIEEYNSSKFSMAGYTITYRMGFIEFHRNDNDNRWLLNLSGQGCRQFEKLASIDLVTMMAILVNVNATFSRLDIAIDDFNNIYKTNTIRQAVYNKQCVTRLEDWDSRTRGKVSSGRDVLTMDSFYLGSSSSRYIINFYDKKIEREQKLKNAGDEAAARLREELHAVETWTRTEIRFKEEYANMFVGYILSQQQDLAYFITAFLNAKLAFLKPSALALDTNKSRLAKDLDNHARWWRKFLNNTKKMKLSVYKPEKMLLETKDWLYHQVSPTLATLALYDPVDFYNLVDKLVLDGLDKMTDKHLQKIFTQKLFDEKAKNAVSDRDMSIKVMPTWVKDRPSLDAIMDVYKQQQNLQDDFERNFLYEQKKSPTVTADDLPF